MSGTGAEGVAPWLKHRHENRLKREFIIMASLRFCAVTHKGKGTEAEKVEAARLLWNDKFYGVLTAGDFLKHTREGVKGVLGDILSMIG